jgi:hypothetical protein
MRSTVLIVSALVPLTGWAQNLVVNPSFEDILTCPNDLSQIELAVGWTGLWGSADLFNACDDDSVSVPFNALGNQHPSDGLGYAGVIYYPQLAKEYIEGMMSEPLQPGVATYVSMRVSPGGFGIPSWTSPMLTASHVGLRFSTAPLAGTLTQYGELEFNDAVLYANQVLTDTSVWTVMSAVYWPDSAYAYLQIGSFFEDGLISADVLDANGDVDQAYAFIDEVCVAQVPGICDGFTSLGEVQRPVLSAGMLIDEFLRLPLTAWGIHGSIHGITLRDHLGRLVLARSNLNGGEVAEWPLPPLASGLYLLELHLRNRPSVVIRCLKP